MRCFIVANVLFSALFAVTMAGRPIPRRNLMASPLPVSCTPSCNELRNQKNTPDVVCSCSSSCLIYGDCCHDAPFRNHDEPRRKELGCLSLSGLGPVSIVNSCPKSTGILSEACAKGLGATNPVTSKDTGTTYSNYYCALCNRDSFNLIDWPVEFQCCKQDKIIRDATVREYVEYNDQNDIMWAVSELTNGSRVFCECKFFARNDNLNFTKSLELRECKHNEISSCIHSWSDDSTTKLCNAFMDPIYIGEKVYRNRHCATCNYENEHRLTCSDEPINPKLMSTRRIFSFCKFRGISNCLYFMRIRGHPILFSEIFSMKEVQCVPPEGQQCCAGEKFDRFRKKCRKLPTRIIM